MNSEIGKWMIGLGLMLTVMGTLVYFFSGKLHWIGRLPGDIRIEKENFHLYIPFTTMLLLSILITILLKLIRILGK